MIQNHDHSEMRLYRPSLSCVMICLCICALSSAQEPIADIVGHAYARSALLLRATFSQKEETPFVEVYVSSDGETFHDVSTGRYRSISYGTQMTTVLVPSLGRSRPEAFVFDKPGTFWLRWRITLWDPNQDKNVPYVMRKAREVITIDQVTEVEPALDVDLRFLSRIGEPKIMRLLGGDDFFQRQTGAAIEWVQNPDVRATVILGTIMRVNTYQINDPLTRSAAPKGDLHKTAETLFAIATDLPDSSYAPYVAYYAGCCYLREVRAHAMQAVRGARKPGVPKDRAAEAKAKFALSKNDPNCAKALRAFRFAAERGDNYLAPRAYYQQAVLRTWNGAFDDAESLLAKSERMAHGAGTIKNICDAFREQMNRFQSEAEGKWKSGP